MAEALRRWKIELSLIPSAWMRRRAIFGCAGAPRERRRPSIAHQCFGGAGDNLNAAAPTILHRLSIRVFTVPGARATVMNVFAIAKWSYLFGWIKHRPDWRAIVKTIWCYANGYLEMVRSVEEQIIRPTLGHYIVYNWKRCNKRFRIY